MTDDEFSMVEAAYPKTDIMKKLGAGLPSEIEGPPVKADQTYYKQFQNDSSNDLKRQREMQIQNRDHMPNNTFMKLFQGT